LLGGLRRSDGNGVWTTRHGRTERRGRTGLGVTHLNLAEPRPTIKAQNEGTAAGAALGSTSDCRRTRERDAPTDLVIRDGGREHQLLLLRPSTADPAIGVDRTGIHRRRIDAACAHQQRVPVQGKARPEDIE
jgi:hypothetical protein